MRKIFTSAIAAVVMGGAVAATALPAQAQSRYYRDRDNNDEAVAAIVGGIAGFALGAMVAGNDNDRRYHRNGYYQPRYSSYYGNGYGYGYAPSYGYAPRYGYRTCTRKERVWDPYTGRRMTVKRRYAC